jgi:hypothetical protein
MTDLVEALIYFAHVLFSKCSVSYGASLSLGFMSGMRCHGRFKCDDEQKHNSTGRCCCSEIPDKQPK